MQSSGRFVENEMITVLVNFAILFGFRTACPARTPVSGFGQMPDEFQTLRFTAGESVQRLTEPQITEPDFIEYIQRLGETPLFANLSEKMDRFAHGQLQDIVNRFVVQFNF